MAVFEMGFGQEIGYLNYFVYHLSLLLLSVEIGRQSIMLYVQCTPGLAWSVQHAPS